ncbi:MAG: alpha/beta hydrolase [Cyanobacteria bacterium J06626_14]
MRRLLLSTVVALMIAMTIPMSSAQTGIQRQDFIIQGEPGIELHVREVSDTAAEGGKPPIILIHGARVPGIASFDLPVAGGSLAIDLAQAGHHVFVMDARGYGGSTRIGQDGSREGNPLVNSNEVVRDIDAVVRAVVEQTEHATVALLGWATGGHWAGMYASLYPETVSHLIMYNALYGAHDGHENLGRGSSLADPNDSNRFNTERFGAYRLNTADSLLPSWDRAIPVEDKTQWRDPRVVEAYQQAALASDPTSESRNPPSFRAPSGAMEDSFYLALGRQLWDAAPITARVLMIRSENDFWSRPEDLTTLQDHLVNAAGVETVTIQNATHHVHLDRREKGRGAFLEAVTYFLN